MSAHAQVTTQERLQDQYEKVAVFAARAVGSTARRLMVKTRPGSAAETGLTLAGFDLEHLRRS